MEQTTDYGINRIILVRDIEVGDILVFKGPGFISRNFDMRYKMYKHAYEFLREKQGDEIEVTQEIFDRVKNEEPIMVVEFKGESFDVDPSYMELVKKDMNEIRQKTNIKVKSFDANIIDEMIKKVDRVRFKKLLVIAGRDREFNMGSLSDDTVDDYLHRWAYAKYEFYLLFNKQLKIEKEIEFIIDEDEMALRKRELQREYPKWSNLLYGFSTREFMDNECYEHNGILEKYYPAYRRGAKLSKVIASLTEDDAFIDSVAGVLDGRIGKGILALSIDPYDYMTSSLNLHGWTSCQNIEEGCYPTGSGAILLDESTIVAYRHNGTDGNYNVRNMPFVGNSKSWRQLFYFDKETCGFVTGRHYPTYNEAVTQTAREFLEEIVTDYTGLENRWIIARNTGMDYSKGSDAVYHDLLEGRSYIAIRHKQSSKYPTVVVGADVPCLICGTSIDELQGSFICSNCDDDRPF